MLIAGLMPMENLFTRHQDQPFQLAAPALPGGLYLAFARPNPLLRFRPVRVTIPDRGKDGLTAGFLFLARWSRAWHPFDPAYTDARDVTQ
jgi:hypothetical protein